MQTFEKIFDTHQERDEYREQIAISIAKSFLSDKEDVYPGRSSYLCIVERPVASIGIDKKILQSTTTA